MRIRTIKPEFFNHEGIYDAEHETKLPLRLAFIGLWCAADREGRFKWEPRRLKTQIMPYDSCDFSRVLDALRTRAFIVRYVTETGDFGCIPSFGKHQVVNNRERPSELPDPCNCNVFDASSTRDQRVNHAGKAEGKGREGNMEGKGKEITCPISSDDSEILKLIWESCPKQGRERSSKRELADAWRKLAAKNKPTMETVKHALTAWNESNKWKTGFCEGIEKWVRNMQWENLPEADSANGGNSIVDRNPNAKRENITFDDSLIFKLPETNE
jgi:hypothetical protein